MYNIANICSQVNSDLTALNDAGAIQGMDAREDGVYITYTPVAGADAVTKKLGSPTIIDSITRMAVAGSQGTRHDFGWFYVDSNLIGYKCKRGVVATKDDNTIIISTFGVSSSRNESIYYSGEPMELRIDAKNYSSIKMRNITGLSGWTTMKLFDADNNNTLIKGFSSSAPVVDISSYKNLILTFGSSDSALFAEVEIV